LIKEDDFLHLAADGKDGGIDGGDKMMKKIIAVQNRKLPTVTFNF